jgi:hypothetical protein
MVIESLRRAIRDIHTPHTQPNKHAHVMKHAHEEHMLAFFSLFSLPYETANGGTRTHTHTQHTCKVQLAILRNVVGLKIFIATNEQPA